MDTVICPDCGKEIEISKAFKHQIEEEVLREERVRQKETLEKQRAEIVLQTEKRIKSELEFKLKNSENEAEETKKRNNLLQNQLLEMTKLIRELKEKDQQRELDLERKLFEQQGKMREDLTKAIQEKANLEKAELQKQLDDTKKALEDAQRKADQKSQQLQGEVLELELENSLKTAFPQDEITPVGKGIQGADIKQIVKSPKGLNCGTILWESKRTKDWSEKWIFKLKEDTRSDKADLAVIISISLPKEASGGFGIKDGIFVCSHELVLPVAAVLRKNLLDVTRQKAISANKEGKAEQLYTFITSHEFQQQIESIIEVYREIQVQIAKEKAVFEKSWKLRETQAQRIISGTANIVGCIQGLVGSSMPQIKGLELDSLEGGDEQQKLIE